MGVACNNPNHSRHRQLKAQVQRSFFFPGYACRDGRACGRTEASWETTTPTYFHYIISIISNLHPPRHLLLGLPCYRTLMFPKACRLTLLITVLYYTILYRVVFG
jgi:hypothetical protein